MNELGPNDEYGRDEFEAEAGPFRELSARLQLESRLTPGELELLSSVWVERNAIGELFRTLKTSGSDKRRRVVDSAARQAEQDYMRLRDEFLATAGFRGLPQPARDELSAFLADVRFES